MTAALIWLGQRGRACLIAGLVAGLALPDVAQALRPWIGPLIALLLVVTGIRVGAKAAFGNLGDLRPTLTRIALFQMALPLAALGLFATTGLLTLPLALAVALMLAAPSVTGAPNFAIMVGHDPAPGMRLLVLGTALFPLTALPVLIVLNPGGAGALGALNLSLGLLLAILASVGTGFAIRRLRPTLGSAQATLDGIAALLLAIVVVGLMSAIGPLLRTDPGTLALWLAAALAVNFGLVLATLLATRSKDIATAIYAGNRNIALFLIVLPEGVAAPLMIFIGCYQIPMYLTPVLLARLRPG
ncbi:MAG: hypothetical protein AAFO80_11815 [Pseudomonadota bacterium]